MAFSTEQKYTLGSDNNKRESPATKKYNRKVQISSLE